ncbi:MAG TPA: molybdopterin-dependent oxidoreductase [Bryobacteraceae bacterium]|jgi:DMSO/TMAO reductase YedYZ molybdopterin-dependent catalytic subunit
MNRRRFLAAAAVSAAGLHADDQKSKLLLPSDEADEFGFRLMWYNPVRAIDAGSFRLKVHGLVEKAQSLSVAELRRLPQESQNSRMKCVQCWSSRTTWGGFRFGHLVENAKPLKSAKAVRIDCADKWYEYFTIEDLLSPRVLMVLDMAGKPLAERHGAPLRLLDPGRYGYKSAKLITSVEFVAEGKGSMACDIGPYYSPTGEIKSGYDHPLDVGANVRRKISGGEITEY